MIKKPLFVRTKSLARSLREEYLWQLLDTRTSRTVEELMHDSGYSRREVNQTLTDLRNEGMVRKLPDPAGWCKNGRAYGTPRGRRHVVMTRLPHVVECSCGWTGQDEQIHRREIEQAGG